MNIISAVCEVVCRVAWGSTNTCTGWHINVKCEVKDNWNMGMGNLGLKGWAFMLNGLAIYDLMGGAFII